MTFSYNIDSISIPVVINLHGRLTDKEQAFEMLTEFSVLLAEDKKDFILNLSDLAYLNSSGLNVLISMLTKARREGGELSITKPSDKVRELFLITKLNAVFPMLEVPEPEKPATEV